MAVTMSYTCPEGNCPNGMCFNTATGAWETPTVFGNTGAVYSSSSTVVYGGTYGFPTPVRNMVTRFRENQPVRTFFSNGGFFRRGGRSCQ